MHIVHDDDEHERDDLDEYDIITQHEIDEIDVQFEYLDNYVHMLVDDDELEYIVDVDEFDDDDLDQVLMLHIIEVDEHDENIM